MWSVFLQKLVHAWERGRVVTRTGNTTEDQTGQCGEITLMTIWESNCELRVSRQCAQSAPPACLTSHFLKLEILKKMSCSKGRHGKTVC